MKKILLFLFAALPASNIFAQLKVNNDGSVVVAESGNSAMTKLTIGISPASTMYNGLGVGITPAVVGYHIGVNSKVTTSDNSPVGCHTIGVMGTAGNSPNSNFGVCGILSGNQNGAGVYGATSVPFPVIGKWAGYFRGPVNVGGTLTATEILTPSDMRFKENVTSMADDATTALSKILSLNVLEYYFNEKVLYGEDTLSSTEQEQPGMTEADEMSETVQDKAERKLHFGVAAQELQEIYPNLVEKGQNGNFYVNYVELVPVLIRAIQELKQQVDVSQGKDAAKRSPAQTSVTGIGNSTAKKNILYQNMPNPAKEQTIIRYQLADNTQDAAICIFDMHGKLLKKLPITSGSDSVTVNAYELGQGMFLYSLVVSGQEIDTKKMIVTK